MKSIHTNVLTLTLAGLLSAASASALAQSIPDTAPTVSAPAPTVSVPAPTIGAPNIDRNGEVKSSLEAFKAQRGQERSFPGMGANQDRRVSKDGVSKQGLPSTQRN